MKTEEIMARLVEQANAKPGVLHVNGNSAVMQRDGYRVKIDCWSGQIRPYTARVYALAGGAEKFVKASGFAATMSGAFDAGERIVRKLTARAGGES